MQGSYDTIVIGLGAIGAATLWPLARRGQRMLGLDRWDPPHTARERRYAGAVLR